VVKKPNPTLSSPQMQTPAVTRDRSKRWLVVIAALAAARWLAMSSPAHFAPWLPATWFRGSAYSLTRSALNVACSWLFLVLLPAALLAARYRPEERPAWGLSLAFTRRVPPWLIPSLTLAGIAFGTIAAWLSSDLRSYYPIYQDAGRSAPHLLLGEGLTFALILATELFYRGAPLFLLERHFGRAAVYLLVPIYTLDHLGATPGEFAASALAGLLLGHLALRTRSIWPGLAAHAACALSVDVTAVIVNGP
jgi:hypothetical protein